MKRRFRFVFPGAGLALALSAFASFGFSGGLREDELECEQAVAHLADCCPDLDPAEISCTYVEGCDSSELTTFSVSESQCIEDLGCDDIRARDLCARVRSLPRPHVDDDGGTSARVEVCP